MKTSVDIKTGKTAVVNGKCKTRGHEAQTGVYSLLYREAQAPSGGSTIADPLPQGWIAKQIRASSMWSWVDCPYRAAEEASGRARMLANVPMHVGTTIHVGTAVYDAARVAGDKPSLRAALDATIDHLWHPSEEIDWQDQTPRKLEPVARECVAAYCMDFSKNVQFAGVEETLADLAVDFPGPRVRIILTGTQDRLRRSIETDTDEPIAEIIGIKTSARNPEVKLGVIRNPEAVLLGDANHGGYLEHLAMMLRTGNLIGNPRSMFCSKRSCPAYPCFYVRGEE